VFLSVLQEVTQYNMVHHTQHTRNKVAKLFFQGFSSYMIGKQLAKEKVVVSGRTIRDWVTRLEQNPDQYYAGRRYKHSTKKRFARTRQDAASGIESFSIYAATGIGERRHGAAS
jgi:IS30 family transposase